MGSLVQACWDGEKEAKQASRKVRGNLYEQLGVSSANTRSEGTIALNGATAQSQFEVLVPVWLRVLVAGT